MDKEFAATDKESTKKLRIYEKLVTTLIDPADEKGSSLVVSSKTKDVLNRLE